LRTGSNNPKTLEVFRTDKNRLHQSSTESNQRLSH